MKSSYINNLTSSFYLWLDHEILSKGEAFTNYSGQLYNSYDPNFPTSTIFSSPFRQWVYDTSINGANIISGVSINDTYVKKAIGIGVDLKIDYNKGRVIFYDRNVTTSHIEASYSFKDYNLYYTDEREDRLLFEKSYSLTPITTKITGGLNHLELPYPCVFIKLKTNDNEPFAFGGLDISNYWIRCIILSRDSFSMDSLTSILADSARKVFPVFNPQDLPFNYFGDLKSGTHYNYINMCKNQGQNNLIYIDKVNISKFDESENLYINKKTVAAIADFELKAVRQPRGH